MGLLKYKTEGGQGGKRGHSNMCHWGTTEEIKAATRRYRRMEAQTIIAKEKDELAQNYSAAKFFAKSAIK